MNTPQFIPKQCTQQLPTSHQHQLSSIQIGHIPQQKTTTCTLDYIPKLNQTETGHHHGFRGTNFLSHYLIQQQDKQAKVQSNINRLYRTIKNKKQQLGFLHKNQILTAIKSFDAIQAFKVKMLITTTIYSENLSKIYFTLCKGRIDQRESHEFTNYWVYLQHSRYNKQLCQSYQNNSENLWDFPQNGIGISIKIICVNQNTYNIVEGNLLLMDASTIEIYQNMIKFVLTDNGEMEYSYYMIFEDTKKMDIWYLFLHQIAQYKSKKNSAEKPADKWMKNTNVRVRYAKDIQCQGKLTEKNQRKDHKININRPQCSVENSFPEKHELFTHSKQEQRMKPYQFWKSQKLLAKIAKKQSLLTDSNGKQAHIYWDSREQSPKYGRQIIQEDDEGDEKYNNRPPKISLNTKCSHNTTQSNEENQAVIRERVSIRQQKSDLDQSQIHDKSYQIKKRRLYTEGKSLSKGESQKSDNDQELQKVRKKNYTRELKAIAKRQATFVREQKCESERYIGKKKTVQNSNELSKHQIWPKFDHQLSNGIDSNEESSGKNGFTSSDQMQQNKVSREQLKNGIVLWKYSKNGWSPHEKKLYLDRNQLELCYCDIHNNLDEKRIYVKDIHCVKYQSFGKGIIKHVKRQIDRKRCLIITHQTNNNQAKDLQFMLSRTDPIENLRDFSWNLSNFIGVINCYEDDNSWAAKQ